MLLARFGFYLAMLILILVFATLSSAFLTLANGINILQQTSTIGIMTLGETLVILAGGIDVSVGSVLGLGGMVAAIVAPRRRCRHGYSGPPRNRSRPCRRSSQRSLDHAPAHRPVHHDARYAQLRPRHRLHRFEPVQRRRSRRFEFLLSSGAAISLGYPSRS